MNKARLRQILLITDGCSNQGICPIKAASIAGKHGVTVNVIGVVQRGMSQSAADEIEQIAKAGGGLYEIVNPQQLSRTVQMVTRQAVTRTIHQVVHQELQQILGTNSIADVPPQNRMQLVEKVEEIGEYSTLEMVVLIDTSASMQPKLQAVEQSVYDLGISLQSRNGRSIIAVCVFPGKANVIDIAMGWTQDCSKISSLASGLRMSGTTPTGPALLSALNQFSGMHIEQFGDQEYAVPHNTKTSTGLLKDYVF